jgi:hypothetical protein
LGLVVQSDKCPYCGERMESGGVVGGHLWWYSPIIGHSFWRVIGRARRRLTSIWRPSFLYGYACSKCEISILDMRDPREVEKERDSQQ